MFRPFAALTLVALMTALSGCTFPLGGQSGTSRSEAPRPSTPEASARPDCRAHCEQEYRVCMDGAVLPRSDTQDAGRVFGPAFNCEERLRSCFKTCASTP